MEKAAVKNPDKVFLYFEDEQVTYKEFDARVNQRANYFLQAGLEKGDTAAILLPNCPEFLYNWLALAKIGAVMVPINTAYKGMEAQYVLNHSEARLLVSNAELLKHTGIMSKQTEHLQEIVSVDTAPNAEVGILAQLAARLPETLPPCEISKDDMATILYTSGTTGPPKGCVLPQEFYTVTGRQFTEFNAIDANDRVMTFLPLFHMAAETTTTMGTLIAEASMVLIDRFSATKFWDQVRKYRPTLFSYIGAVLSILEDLPESSEDRTHSIRRCFGGGATKELTEMAERRFNITVVEGYGSTEDGLVLSNYYKNGQRRVGSIGKPAPGRAAKIVDDAGNELPPGQKGEIAISGGPMMLGYFKDPVATAEVMKDGWFYTGDNGYMDEDGFVYFSERKKDIIRRAGENISSAEVENVIRSHPGVLDVAVVAVPDKIRKEEVKAYIMLRTGETEATVPPTEIVAHCSERLAYFKVPRYIEYRTTDFPRTLTNKILKHELKKEKADLTEGCFDREKAKFNGIQCLEARNRSDH